MVGKAVVVFLVASTLYVIVQTFITLGEALNNRLFVAVGY